MTHRNTEQPKNYITLMNGEALECFQKQSPKTTFAPDEMQLNATGTYLGMGIKPCKPQPNADEEKEHQKKLFTDNAFYLLAHSKRIMRDSRMFLAPVAVQNGLAYTGTSGFNAPTVGIYLEWCATCPEALRTDKEGCRSLVFHLAGSPLSGANCCAEVYEDGRVKSVSVSLFASHWQSFTAINTRYDEAKHIYQVYTLEQVLDILHAEDSEDWNYSVEIKERFMQSEINQLKKSIEQITAESDKWHSMYADTWLKHNEEEISGAFPEFLSFKEHTEREIDLINKQKRKLKVELKNGHIKNTTYQRTLTPLNKQTDALELKVITRQHELFDQFLSAGISYCMIESYMNKKNEGWF